MGFVLLDLSALQKLCYDNTTQSADESFLS